MARVTRKLRARSFQTRSSSQASAAVIGRSNSSEDLTFDLDWRPVLSLVQEVICWSCAAALTCLVYTLSAPSTVSIPYGTCMGLVFGMSLYLLRGALLEELYKARERIEADLGDTDSRFRDLGNLLVHVKIKAAKTLPPPVAQNPNAARYAPPTAVGNDAVTALHCYHGFGSNTWSWTLVQEQIASRLGALVTAHDMPGFGLTQRPTDLSSYYLAFNGRLGRLALDYELAIRGLLSFKDAQRAGEAGYPHTSVHDDAASQQPSQEVGLVQGLEAAAGGSPAAAAKDAANSGTEPAMQSAAAAAAQGSIGGTLKAAAGALQRNDTAGSDQQQQQPASSQQGGQSRVKRVLMGHSLGGACAALEYINNPHDYAAIVLVDPAIIAGLGGPGEKDRPTDPVRLEMLQDGTAFTHSHASADASDIQPAAANAAATGSTDGSITADLDQLAEAQGNLTRSSSTTSGSESDSSSSSNRASNSSKVERSGLRATVASGEMVLYATRGDDATFRKLIQEQQSSGQSNAAVNVLTKSMGLIRSFVLLSTVLALSILRPVIVLLLRVAVRSRKFWANTLQQAYYDKSKVTPEAVDAYRLPQLVRGWETGMVQFLMARLGAGGTRAATTAAGAAGVAPPGGLEDANLATRFAAAVATHNTPVLIVHGAGDKLIPASNSFKLARLIKGCRLAVLKRSGHCPQEEQPEEFSDVVCGFLGKRLGV